MVSNIVVIINIFGVLVSIFSVYVTVRIYQKYKLNSSLFFVFTASSIFLWNLLHLILNFIEESNVASNQIRFLWLILVYSGITFFFTFVFGYSNLRYEYLNWRLIVYTALATAFSVLFATQRVWVDVSYDQVEGWVTTVFFQPFWTIFSFSILLLGFIEIIIPLVNTYSRSEENKRPVSIMLVAVLFAIFSNALEPVLTTLGLPQAIRFLAADVGFLLFFLILLLHPFTGLYDTTILHQAIVANDNGTPLVTLSKSSDIAILTSGAMIGINSILDEITSENHKMRRKSTHEDTRKIELGKHQFFIIIKEKLIVLFQFENPSGVCYSKFISLSRIFSESDSNEDTMQNEQIEKFKVRLNEYYRNFFQNTSDHEGSQTFSQI